MHGTHGRKYLLIAGVCLCGCGGSSGNSGNGADGSINSGSDAATSFDGSTNTNTNTNTVVDAGPCVADCTGRVCGDDGCGGSCGDCTGDQTCGVDGQCQDGYLLWGRNNGTSVQLQDLSGTVVHQWTGLQSGGYSSYLLPNGNLLRPAQAPSATLSGGAAAGLLQEITPSGSVAWQYTYSSSTVLAHHDIEPMPNGNVLLIAWEVKSAAEAAALGRQNAQEMWPDHIIEVQPSGASGGTIVWEWHAWDHLIQDVDPSKPNYGVVADHPELLDINLGASSGGPPGPGGGGGDWLHINGVSYNPERDEIVISSHFMNEIYVIDHSTTTAEAAGHTGGNRGKGGDILYRWGNPNNYASGTQVFYVVHCAWWVPTGMSGAGHLMAFNNGDSTVMNRSSRIEEIVPPLDANGGYALTGSTYGPAASTWTYSEGTSFFSAHLGGLQRLPSGNTFIVESTTGYMFEVTAAGTKVWDYQASGEVARALRYAANDAAIQALIGQ